MSPLLVAPAGWRLDQYVSQQCHLPRSQVQRLIEQGFITVNGQPARPGLRLRSGDKVKVVIPPPPPSTLTPEEIPLSIVYEDADLVVVDKPAGLTVHPAPGHPRGTLVNALLARYPSLPGELPRPGLVHRLDKDTSGLLIVAKTQRAQEELRRQFQERSLVKGYLVLVKGKLVPSEGSIQAPIARHPRRRQQMAVMPEGREATTQFRVLRYIKEYSLLEVTPKTGRTHQIRVHLAAAGYPVVGDRVYGVKSSPLPRQFLHAHYLRFQLPGGEEIELTSPLPPDLEQGLRLLEEDA